MSLSCPILCPQGLSYEGGRSDSLSLSNGLNGSNSSTPGPSHPCVLSIPRELLRHEMGGGLKVEYAFSREDTGGYASQTVCRLLLRLTNMRDTPIRRVKVVNADPRVLPFEELSSLEPGATVEVRLGVDFKVMGPPLQT